MSLADDLIRLEQMHERGSLTDAEFASAKQRCLSGSPRQTEPLSSTINGLRRSDSERWLGGVCGGLAAATGMQAWLWRILFVAFTTLGAVGAFVYLALWLFVPLHRDLLALPPMTPPPAMQ